MKNLISLIILMLFLCLSAFGQVKCDVFKVNGKLNDNHLSVSLTTDLPNNTDIMVSVSRSYWNDGDTTEYEREYFSEKSTVQKWRVKHVLVINNNNWIKGLNNNQKALMSSGLSSNVRKISDSLNIDIIVPVIQSNPKFGKGNSKLIGKKVSTSFLRTVEGDTNIYYPINKKLSKESKFANPLDLKNSKIYMLSKKTPIMPSYLPKNPISALSKMKYLSANGMVKLISKKKVDNIIWYKVYMINRSDKIIGIGWINSMALMGQNIKIIQ